jgi:hypothetical protein
MSGFKLIFDNGGGTVAQFVDREGRKFAHYYPDAAQVAEDVLAFLADEDVSGWEGHEEALEALNPSGDEIRNGGYRTYSAGGDLLAEVRDLVTAAEQSGWGNALEFVERMRDNSFVGVV